MVETNSTESAFDHSTWKFGGCFPHAIPTTRGGVSLLPSWHCSGRSSRCRQSGFRHQAWNWKLLLPYEKKARLQSTGLSE